MWNRLKLLCPDSYQESLLKIELGELQDKGIKGIIVDMDNTLVPYHQRSLDTPVLEWMKQAKIEGFKMCIVSNNLAAQGEELARELDTPAIWSAVKPRSRSFRKALQIMELAPKEVAVIGDQVFTDILGGNRLGMYTILVVPLSQKEMIWTKAIRSMERKFLNLFERKGFLEKK